MYTNQFTSPGVREQNEDTIYPEPGRAAASLFIVADGLGGHADGQVASTLACRTMTEIVERENPATFVLGGYRLSESDLMQAFLSDAVRQAGVTVWQEARQRGSDMGSTLLAVLLKNGRGHGARVGDSALWVSPDGQMPLARLTTPHRRGAGLTRSLGTQEQVTADVFTFDFTEASVLVMGSDGFWEHVDEETLGQLLQERPPFCIAAELGQAALAAGSQDNVSVVVVEGEAFAAQHAATQIEAYAAKLARAAATTETIAQRRALLEFCTRYPDGGPGSAAIAAQLAALLGPEAAPRVHAARPAEAEAAQSQAALQQQALSELRLELREMRATALYFGRQLLGIWEKHAADYGVAPEQVDKVRDWIHQHENKPQTQR